MKLMPFMIKLRGSSQLLTNSRPGLRSVNDARYAGRVSMREVPDRRFPLKPVSPVTVFGCQGATSSATAKAQFGASRLSAVGSGKSLCEIPHEFLRPTEKLSVAPLTPLAQLSRSTSRFPDSSALNAVAATDSAESWDVYEAVPIDLRLKPEFASCREDMFEADPVVQTNILHAILSSAEAAILGHESQFVVWNEATMRLEVSVMRLTKLSITATVSVMNSFASGGSYLRRLRYTADRIARLQPHSVALALSSVVRELVTGLYLQLPHGDHNLLSYFLACCPLMTSAQTLAVILGCGDLSRPARLSRLPSVTKLLNVAYNEVMRRQNNPRLYPMLWHVVRSMMMPWLAQLGDMTGLGSTSFFRHTLDPALVSVDTFPEMFLVPSSDFPGFFCVDTTRVPLFVPIEHAQTAVECLNYCMLLSRVGVTLPKRAQFDWLLEAEKVAPLNSTNGSAMHPSPHEVGTWRLSALTKDMTILPQHNTVSSWFEPPVNPELALLELFTPLFAQNNALNDAMWDEFINPQGENFLRGHLELLFGIGLLENGVFFSRIADLIATSLREGSPPREIQLNQLSTYIDDAAITAGLKCTVSASICYRPVCTELVGDYFTDSFELIYKLPLAISCIITPPVIATCEEMNRCIIRLREDALRAVNDRDVKRLHVAHKSLFAIASKVQAVHHELNAMIAERCRLSQLLCGLEALRMLPQSLCV